VSEPNYGNICNLELSLVMQPKSELVLHFYCCFSFHFDAHFFFLSIFHFILKLSSSFFLFFMLHFFVRLFFLYVFHFNLKLSYSFSLFFISFWSSFFLSVFHFMVKFRYSFSLVFISVWISYILSIYFSFHFESQLFFLCVWLFCWAAVMANLFFIYLVRVSN